MGSKPNKESLDRIRRVIIDEFKDETLTTQGYVVLVVCLMRLILDLLENVDPSK